MKPETNNPLPPGTRVMVIAAPNVPSVVGATGEIVSPYQCRVTQRIGRDGAARGWFYGVVLDRHPSPNRQPWAARHRQLVPLCLPDPVAEPQSVEVSA